MNRSIPRRRVLQGLFGAQLALPVLEATLDPRRGWAAPAPPKRFFLGFGGFSLGADGDPLHNDYVPTKVGAGYDASAKSAIAPLAKNNLSTEVTVVSGLRVPRNTGPGHYSASRFHGGNHSPLLSGVPTSGDAAGLAEIHGVTADQVVADAFAGQTKFRSLHFCVQPKIYSGGPAYGWIVSMRRKGTELERIEPTLSPQQAYKSLFFNFQKLVDEAALKAFERERKIRMSVLDACRASRERLSKRLGRSDMAVMDQYYDHCRDIENLIATLRDAPQGACTAPEDPGDDPAMGGDTFSSMQNNGMAPPGTGWSNETLRGEIFAELTAMAFACDLTRAVTTVYTRNQCFMSAREVAGYGVDLHSLGHRIGGSPSTTLAVSKGIAWHITLFGRLVERLRSLKEGTGGSVLDNSALVLVNEGGHGPNPEEAAQFGASDLVNNGSSHSMENMACVIAGGSGGLKRGHHVATDGKHPVNVLLTLVNAVGVDVDKMGEVSGTVPQLRT